MTLVRPIEDEVQLQNLNQLDNSELREEFISGMNKMRKKIYRRVQPKMIKGKYITPKMLISLSKAYIEAINKGSSPNIESAWRYLCKN